MAKTNLPSAAQRVFAIPELLTTILELVEDPFQLFVLQSISGTFQAIIRDTESIRRRMCLEPTEDRNAIDHILNHPTLRRVMEPYLVTLDNPGRDNEYFDFELGCRWIWRNKCEMPEGPRFKDFACVQKGSWRSVILGLPDKSIFTMVSCEIQGLGEFGNVQAGESLGSTMQRVIKTTEKSWADEYSCTHGSPDWRGDRWRGT